MKPFRPGDRLIAFDRLTQGADALRIAMPRRGGGVLARLLGALNGAPSAPLGAPPAGSEGVWFLGDRVARSTAGARRLLGDAAKVGRPAREASEAIAAGDPEIAEALAALLRNGEPFRARATSPDGRSLDLDGAPDGPAARLALRDATADARREGAERAERAAAEAERAALRAALEAAGAPVRRVSADGRTIWRSRGARDDGADEDETRIPLEDGGALAVGLAEGERRLRRFEETVTETFGHLRVGLAVFGQDRRLQLANPALAEMFGDDRAWLDGRPTLREALDRLREARRLPEQADYPAWRSTLFTLFDDPSHAAFEDVWELPDGRAIQVLVRPYPAGGLIFVFEDVTESIALQRWRATAVEVRRATLDMLSEAVAVFGPDGRVRIANPAFRAIWGLEGEADLGAGHVAEIAAACAPLAAGEDIWSRIRATVAQDDSRASWLGRVGLADGRVVTARIAPMPDGSTLAAFSDITDSERVAKALRERATALEAAEQMRDALVDQLSHQLRTPLNAIFGFSEMLIADERLGALTPTQRDYLETIRDAAHALRDGVDNLAELATMQAGSVELSVGDMALAPALRGAAELVARRLADRGARMGPVAAPEDLVLRGDPARLRQMIFNLLSACATCACEGGVLSAGAAVEGDAVALWAVGCGCRTVETELGFALARRVAELHGGTIALEADTGRVVIRLPRDGAG